jgi:hypothetical protein
VTPEGLQNQLAEGWFIVGASRGHTSTPHQLQLLGVRGVCQLRWVYVFLCLCVPRRQTGQVP